MITKQPAIKAQSGSRYITTREAAERLGVSQNQITKWCRRKILEAIRLEDATGQPWLIKVESLKNAPSDGHKRGNAIWCPNCSQFFPAKHGRICPDCGERSDSSPVQVNAEDWGFDE